MVQELQSRLLQILTYEEDVALTDEPHAFEVAAMVADSSHATVKHVMT